MTIVNAISAQPTTENTLLILAQKLVGGCPITDSLTISVFFASDGSSSLPTRPRLLASPRKSHLSASTMEALLFTSQRQYAPGAVGMIIAGALLKRLLAISIHEQQATGNFAVQDMSAIYGWVQRIIGGSRDTSAAYAMDVLSLMTTSM
jgi:hypothetical protein